MKMLKSTLLLITSAAFACLGILGILGSSISQNIKKIEFNLPNNTVKGDAGPEEVYVYVKGEVENPGFYILESGNTVDDAINAAGGLTPYADITYTKLSDYIFHGDEIYIPSLDETKKDDTLKEDDTSKKKESVISDKDRNTTKLNVNTASANELIEIKGIGPVLATKIIRYREEHGGKIENLEELMNISGIAKKRFNALKEYLYAE